MHLHAYAADLARSPDGRWWVVGDRTQAPSGSGYALENRIVVSRVFPQMFRALPVQQLASFFDALRSALLHWAPRGDGPTRIVLLTPGPVQRDLLRARAPRALSRLPAGRRQRPDGARRPRLPEDARRPAARARDLAPPGRRLLRPARAAHRLGARRRRPDRMRAARQRAARQRARLGRARVGRAARLPAQLARELLGEPLLLPSVATWWFGEPAAFEDAWRNPERLIIKPLERSASERPIVVEDLTRSRAQRPARAHRGAAAALRGAGMGACVEGAGARARCRRRLRGAHRRPARLRGRHAERLAGHAGRPDPRRRRRGVARHRDAARRPLQGHLGALRRPGQCRVLAALAHRHRRSSSSMPTRRWPRAPPRTCSGSAATASAATSRCGCCAWPSAMCSTIRARAAAASSRPGCWPSSSA